MTECPAPGELVTVELDRVLTQYRESPNLLYLARTFLTEVDTIIQSICGLPEEFDIDSAMGDQLTLIGKRLGWPRCHCVCVTQPVFGFACEDDDNPADFPIVGFCEAGSWVDCNEFGVGEICITDDEVYRGFLKARRYQFLSLYDRFSLTQALQHLWGDTAAIMDDGNGRVVMTPGRELTNPEIALLQLVPRVLPVAIGIRQRFHFGPREVFGFGEGWGGFCEEWEPDGLFLAIEDGSIIVADDDGTGGDDPQPISTSPLTRDAEWLCEIDLKPYQCASA